VFAGKSSKTKGGKKPKCLKSKQAKTWSDNWTAKAIKVSWSDDWSPERVRRLQGQSRDDGQTDDAWWAATGEHDGAVGEGSDDVWWGPKGGKTVDMVTEYEECDSLKSGHWEMAKVTKEYHPGSDSTWGKSAKKAKIVVEWDTKAQKMTSGDVSLSHWGKSAKTKGGKSGKTKGGKSAKTHDYYYSAKATGSDDWTGSRNFSI